MDKTIIMCGVVSSLLLGAGTAHAADMRQVGEGGGMDAVVSRFVGTYTTPPVAESQGIPDAPLLGNGDLAVAVGGSYTSQTFHLTKSDLGVGNRAAGQVRLRVEGTLATPEQYRQEQDLRRAEVRSTLPFAEGALRIRSWTADSDDILVSELDLENGSALNLAIEIKADKGAGARDGVAWACRERGQGRAVIACRVLGAASQTATSGVDTATIRFALRAGQPLRLVTVVAGGTNTAQAVETAVAKAAGLTEETLGALQREHREWWTRYWSRSWIELNDELLEKYYYGALYVMGCASRSNGVAPGLAGAWHVGPSLLWGNNYTMDYNFEAPWWGVYTCNRAELADPYDRVLFDAVPSARELARKYGVKGLLMSVILEPGGGEDRGPLLGMKGAASLAVMNLISRYEYTQDDAFLLKAWPFLNDLAVFWEHNLEWDEIGLRWVIRDSACREYMGEHSNAFGPDKNPINDLSYLRRFLGFLLRVSDRLEGLESEGRKISAKLGGRASSTAAQDAGGQRIMIGAERRQKWRDYLENLSPAPTIEFKGKMVFREAESGKYYPDNRFCFLGPGDNADVLMGVFPGEAVGLGSDPRLLQIARHTVAALNSNTNDLSWFQGNNFPKIFSQAVRAGYPAEEVAERLRQRLSNYNGRPATLKSVRSYMPDYKGEWLMNNFAINSMGHAIESVGAIEAINSMLLQSADTVIRVFPVWLKDRDARFTNLRAKGAFLVSSEYKAGQVRYVEIQSEAGQPVTLENPWPGTTPEVCEVTSDKLKKVRARFDGRQLVFETRKDGRYRVQAGERDFTVSQEGRAGDEVAVTVQALRDTKARLPHPWPLYGVQVSEIKGDKVNPVDVRNDDGLLRFRIKAGSVYRLVRRNQLAQVELTAEPRRCSTVTPVRLSASGRMSDGTAAPIERVRLDFASDNERLATVDAAGAVTCRKPGIVGLSATATLDGEAVTGTLKLNVQPHQLQRVTVQPDLTVFATGRRVRLSVRGEMTDGSAARLEAARIAYTSSDERLATVSPDGVVTLLAEGRVALSAAVTLDGVRVSDALELVVTREPIIQQVSAADNGEGTPRRLVNGSGLSGLSLEATHDNAPTGGSMWSTHVRPGADGAIRFDLGAVYNLDELWVWNHNQAWGLEKRGFRNVTIFHSLDGQAWTELKGPGYPYQFAPADGKPGLKATNLNDGKHTPVRFGGVAARYVKLVADPNPGVGSWGPDPYFGLSEVMFTAGNE